MIRYITVVVALLMGLSATGCRTVSAPAWTKGWFAEDKPQEVEESKYAQPARMAAIWSPAMFNAPGKKPVRGFGGRIYFYDGANKAVPVEGQLVVYAYNDTHRKPDASRQADRKFAFTPEQFTTHYAPTELGASYSIWIPWDEVGNPQMEISLVPIFTATSGQVVVGGSSKNLLPGPTTVAEGGPVQRYEMPPPVHRFPPVEGGVQQASFDAPQAMQHPSQPMGHQPRATFQETSIDLPSTLAARLATAGPQSGGAQQSTVAVHSATQELARPSAGVQPSSASMPTVTTGTMAAPWAAARPPVHYGRPAHPAPSLRVPPQVYGRPQTPQFHGVLPSAPPSSPIPANATQYRAAS